MRVWNLFHLSCLSVSLSPPLAPLTCQSSEQTTQQKPLTVVCTPNSIIFSPTSVCPSSSRNVTCQLSQQAALLLGQSFIKYYTHDAARARSFNKNTQTPSCMYITLTKLTSMGGAVKWSIYMPPSHNALKASHRNIDDACNIYYRIRTRISSTVDTLSDTLHKVKMGRKSSRRCSQIFQAANASHVRIVQMTFSFEHDARGV